MGINTKAIGGATRNPTVTRRASPALEDRDDGETCAKTRRNCPWCGTVFTPRTSGGKPQQFCSSRCRRALENTLRTWAQDQLAEGRVTVAQLQRPRCVDGHGTHD